MDEAGEEGKCDATENCENDGWQGGKGVNAGGDGKGGGEGDDWGRGMTT
jgi:hypothetical protein